MSWTIVNGEERHAQHPDTFEIPAERDRKSLGSEISPRFALRVVKRASDSGCG